LNNFNSSKFNESFLKNKIQIFYANIEPLKNNILLHAKLLPVGSKDLYNMYIVIKKVFQ